MNNDACAEVCSQAVVSLPKKPCSRSRGTFGIFSHFVFSKSFSDITVGGSDNLSLRGARMFTNSWSLVGSERFSSLQSLEVCDVQEEYIQGEEILFSFCPRLCEWSHSGEVSPSATSTRME